MHLLGKLCGMHLDIDDFIFLKAHAFLLISFVCSNDLRAYLSKLTELPVKTHRVEFSVNVWNLQWYFIRARSFGGIFQKS